MPHQLTKLTPNLVVSDVARSIAFYRDVLGFGVQTTVPDQEPYGFAIVQSGPVGIFLNAPEPAIAEYPAFRDKEIGGTFTMYIDVTGIERMYDELKTLVPVVAALESKWYGVTEFVVSDPDGYLITLGERM